MKHFSIFSSPTFFVQFVKILRIVRRWEVKEFLAWDWFWCRQKISKAISTCGRLKIGIQMGAWAMNLKKLAPLLIIISSSTLDTSWSCIFVIYSEIILPLPTFMGLSHLHHQVTHRRGKKTRLSKSSHYSFFSSFYITIEFLVSYQLLLKISQNP